MNTTETKARKPPYVPEYYQKSRVKDNVSVHCIRANGLGGHFQQHSTSCQSPEDRNKRGFFFLSPRLVLRLENTAVRLRTKEGSDQLVFQLEKKGTENKCSYPRIETHQSDL